MPYRPGGSLSAQVIIAIQSNYACAICFISRSFLPLIYLKPWQCKDQELCNYFVMAMVMLKFKFLK